MPKCFFDFFFFFRIRKPVWVPTIKATSVTQDTAVDSLSAATTTMNSGVSPCPLGDLWHSRVLLVTVSAHWEMVDWAMFLTLLEEVLQVETVAGF